jgi:4-hydroxy-tetrahydrodipicolinate synthase
VTDRPIAGTWFVLPTPFAEDGSLDEPSLRRLIDAAISWGVDGLTAMGVTSEAANLDRDERAAALRTILEASAGRVAVVVGCSADSAAEVSERMEEAAGLGARAAMVAAPPGSTADSLPRFYREVADSPLDVVVQDEPAATGVTVTVEVLLRCVDAAAAIALKLEDPPTPAKIARLLEHRPSLAVFGGLGGAFALSELRRGACGTMTGFAFPEILAAVRRAVEAGETGRAARTFDRYLPLIAFEAQPRIGLAVRKELLRRRGVFETALIRAGAELDPLIAAELDDVLERVGITPAPGRSEVPD